MRSLQAPPTSTPTTVVARLTSASRPIGLIRLGELQPDVVGEQEQLEEEDGEVAEDEEEARRERPGEVGVLAGADPESGEERRALSASPGSASLLG